MERDIQPTLEEIVDLKLVESGEKDRLKEVLIERLVECGWRDEMKSLCREFARKKGRDNVTVDELVNVITPKGRGLDTSLNRIQQQPISGQNIKRVEKSVFIHTSNKLLSLVQ